VRDTVGGGRCRAAACMKVGALSVCRALPPCFIAAWLRVAPPGTPLNPARVRSTRAACSAARRHLGEGTRATLLGSSSEAKATDPRATSLVPLIRVKDYLALLDSQHAAAC
jgi:hypothetical protein